VNSNATLLHLGTSSWSCPDWVGKVYAPGTPPADFIAAYARKFDTVEIDATFYATPRKTVVEGWRDRTPDTFLFAAKAPQVITHEKCLADCGGELKSFLDVMSVLGPRLGPILFQLPYFSKASGMTKDELLARLKPFLASLPEGFQWAVEIRNKAWLGESLFELLAERRVALALIDHPWMYRPKELFAREGVLTGPFAYIRWLGDRYAIEKITTTWGETVIDRRVDVAEWVPHLQELIERRLPVFGYVNNHYAGYAPDTLALIQDLLGNSEHGAIESRAIRTE
jgi:uncharacterized protein YecE (DUF72 family)